MPLWLPVRQKRLIYLCITLNISDIFLGWISTSFVHGSPTKRTRQPLHYLADATTLCQLTGTPLGCLTVIVYYFTEWKKLTVRLCHTSFSSLFNYSYSSYPQIVKYSLHFYNYKFSFMFGMVLHKVSGLRLNIFLPIKLAAVLLPSFRKKEKLKSICITSWKTAVGRQPRESSSNQAALGYYTERIIIQLSAQGISSLHTNLTMSSNIYASHHLLLHDSKKVRKTTTAQE